MRVPENFLHLIYPLISLSNARLAPSLPLSAAVALLYYTKAKTLSTYKVAAAIFLVGSIVT